MPIRTIDQILGILERGSFDELVGTTEDLYVEAKGEPYRLSSGDLQKQELAKDVSALANSGGGIILLGFRTKQDQLSSIEEVECCRSFPPSLFDPIQYRNVLQDWIHPVINSVRAVFYPSASDPNRGTAAIIVPANAAAEKPYIVTRVVAPDGRVCGTMFGYFERVLDRVVPMSGGTIRSQLRDGMRFNEFSERLTNLEIMLTQRFSQVAEANPSPDKIAEKLREAGDAVGRVGQPNIVLAAASTSECKFTQLFESQTAPVVKLLEEPPILRWDGFAIKAPRPSSIIKGQLRRRVVPGYELIDLWKDGTLIAIGPGDYELLCWARQTRAGVGLPIRNFVLAEVILNFVRLAAEVFKQATPLPRGLRFIVRLENMTIDGIPCTLSSERDNIRFPRAGEKKVAPDSRIDSSFVTPFEQLDVGRVVYELLGQIYTFFGFHESDMPYVDGNDPKRITPKSMFIELHQ